MSLSAAVVAELVRAGLMGEALVEACARIEAATPAPVDQAAANKRAYDREYRRQQREREAQARTTSYDSHDINDAPSPLSPQKKDQIPPLNPPTKLAVVREPVFVLPSDIPEAEWDAFDEARRKGKNRGKWTYRAKQAAVAKLRKLAEDGHPPGEVLTHCLLSGYDGIFAPKDRRNDRTPHRSNERSGSRRRTIADYVADQYKERAAGMG